MELKGFGLFDQNFSLAQVKRFSRITCFGAKWLGSREVLFFSEWEHGQRGMLEAMHRLWNEADALVTYNGDSFDIKHFNFQFAKLDLPPPPPVASIDLIKTVRGRFKCDSKKLDHVAQALGLGRKVQHTGFDLWDGVDDGDPKAQRTMERYCKQDVRLTERVYKKLRPWIRNHPYLAMTDADACPNCQSRRVQKRGVRRTRARLVQRIHCQNCSSWFDGKASATPKLAA